MNNKALAGRLTAYSVAAAAVFSTACLLKPAANIHYQDFIPDYVLSAEGDSVLIDIYEDGIIDYKFRLYSGVYQGDIYKSLIVVGYNGNQLLLNGSTTSYLPNAVEFEQLIPVSTNTSYSSSLTLCYISCSEGACSTYGQFIGKKNAFMGVSFIINNEIHMGWIRLSVAPNMDKVVIHDAGINETPYQAIKAGIH